IDGIEFLARRRVDQIEKPREAVAEIEAAPAAVADLEDAMHLRLDLREVGEVRVFPGDRVAGGGFGAAFAHGLPCSSLTSAKGAAGWAAPSRTSSTGDQPTVSRAFWKRPAWDFSALARVSNQSAISSKPSCRAVRAMPGYMSVYSWVSPAIAALRLDDVPPIGRPVAGSPLTSRNSRWPCAWPVSPSAVERKTAATSL